MFLNPHKAVKQGWLKGINEEDIQPNAVDISINKIYTLLPDEPFYLYKNKKVHKNRSELDTCQNLWKLKPGAYDFFSNAYIKVPIGVCGWLITRSTLNRNGIIVHSGLYDSGYEGHINGTMYIFHGENFIEEGACVAQFIMAPSESVGLYAGGYNTAEGDIIPDQLKNHIK